jgi:hypothetical protein
VIDGDEEQGRGGIVVLTDPTTMPTGEKPI